jgi:phosphatidylserine/phosphatidylglycerophosphate/cardiolipin synthase-like enzyme
VFPVKNRIAALLPLLICVIFIPLLLHASVPRGTTTRVAGEDIRILRSEDYLNHLYFQTLAEAEKRIWIVTYSITGPDSARMASVYDRLQERQEEGVNVRLLMSGELERNEEIYEALKEKYDFEVRMYDGERTMHVKTILVDDAHVYSGSANLTLTAFGRPSESTIYLKSEELAEQIKSNIDNLWEERI